MNTTLKVELNSINQMHKNSLNVSHVLFAQDLVGYVISSCKPSFRFKPLVENCFEHCRNPFNDNVKNAINCMLFYVHRKNRYPFKNLITTGEGIPDKYMKCVMKLQASYFSKGFTLTNFLYFCVDIAIMTLAFFNSGMKDAPKVAVICIVNALNNYDRRKCFARMDKITEEFPHVCDVSLNKAVHRLKDDLKDSLWPFTEITDFLRLAQGSRVAVNPVRKNLELSISQLKELNEVNLSDESSGFSSEVEMRFVIQ